jgi:hypothetical protein
LRLASLLAEDRERAKLDLGGAETALEEAKENLRQKINKKVLLLLLLLLLFLSLMCCGCWPAGVLLLACWCRTRTLLLQQAAEQAQAYSEFLDERAQAYADLGKWEAEFETCKLAFAMAITGHL